MREIKHYYNFRMNKEKEEYFRDLEEVLQSLKKQIQIEEERNAKWSKIAKDEGLGSIVFNQENVESSTASSKDIMEDDRRKELSKEDRKYISDIKRALFSSKEINDAKATTDKDVEIIDNTMLWTMQGSPLSKTLHITGDGHRFKRWETNWKHPEFPSLMVTVEYDTTDAPEDIMWPENNPQNKSNDNSNLLSSLNQSREEYGASFHKSDKNIHPYTCVKNVNITIDIDDEDTGILFMNNEMEPLIEYCQIHNDIPFFFSNITKMLESCRERQQIVASHGMRREEGILRGFDQFGTIPTENDSYEILIKTSSRVVLASILWKIAFNADYQACLRIGETFKVNFTEKGQIIATECNFPEELTSNGKYPDWSNSETLHNLRQLSRMDIEDYPLPNTRTSTPLNSGQKGKGIGKRRKILT